MVPLQMKIFAIQQKSEIQLLDWRTGKTEQFIPARFSMDYVKFTIHEEKFLYHPQCFPQGGGVGCVLYDIRILKQPLIFRPGEWSPIESKCGNRYISQLDRYKVLWNINTITWDAVLISTDENVRATYKGILLPDRIVMECVWEDLSKAIQIWECQTPH